MVLKALILAGGRGKRLGEHTNEINKCMLEFGGKPLIGYSLENAAKIRVDEIVIVVGHMAELIINKIGINYKGIPIKYVIQKEQKGLVHAIGCSKSTIGDADIALFLGDEFFINPDHVATLKEFVESDAFAVCGVVNVEDKKQISKTYSLLIDQSSNQVIRLIEKPKNALNNLKGTGNCIFKNKIFDYIDVTPTNQKRGEKELPDLIQCAIDDGKKVFYHILSSKYVNVNTPEDIDIIEKETSSQSNLKIMSK